MPRIYVPPCDYYHVLSSSHVHAVDGLRKLRVAIDGRVPALLRYWMLGSALAWSITIHWAACIPSVVTRTSGIDVSAHSETSSYGLRAKGHQIWSVHKRLELEQELGKSNMMLRLARFDIRNKKGDDNLCGEECNCQGISHGFFDPCGKLKRGVFVFL